MEADFRGRLTRLGRVFVNDAFGASHRAHGSVAGVACPVRVGGFLLKKEVQYLEEVVNSPKRPLTFIMGGAKINDKIKLIDRVIEMADNVIVCGGMSYTLQKKRGKTIG